MNKQLSYLYLTIRNLVAPLEESLSSLEGLEYLFYKYGWEIDLQEDVYSQINQALVFKEPLNNFIAAADILIDKLPEEEISLSDLNNLVEQGKNLIQLIANFEILSLDEVEGPISDPVFWNSIADHLLDDLLISYIQSHQPTAYSILHFFGVIRHESINSDANFRINYIRNILDWQQLLQVVSNPYGAFKSLYKWNNNGDNLDHVLLLNNIQKSLAALKSFSQLLVPSDDFLDNIEFNPSAEYNIEQEVMELLIPFLYGLKIDDSSVFELGMSVSPIPENGNEAPKGLLVKPVARGLIKNEIKISNDFMLDLNLGGEASNQFQLKIFPNHCQLDSGALNFNVGFGLRSTFSKPKYIFGTKDTTRLELQGLNIDFKVLGSSSDPEIQFSVKFNGDPGLNAIIDFDNADSFLKNTIAKKPIEAGFSPEIIWSTKSGITFNGSPSFDTTVGLNKEISAIKFKNLSFSLGEKKRSTETKNLALSFGLGLEGKLGPVSFAVEKMGFDLDVIPYTRQQLQEQSFNEPSLIFGNLGLDLNYLAPRGVSLSIDSDIISGGGFLEFDQEKHQYVGIMSLKFTLEKVDLSLTAIGLVNTRLPNSESGYSMLVSISTYFTPGYQLAFGFTLNAVGGLLGIHRTMKVDILQDRVRNGGIRSVMFPENVVENASRIISDLRSIFPVEKDHYVVAPFFRIGYATPTVLEVDLGILTELPFAGRLILLGSLSVYLPNKEHDKRLGEIHVDLFGDFNFAASYILLEGRLRDSQLVGIPFSGGFAFVLDWGSSPQFLISVGGYHPRYKKPARFPAIPRVNALIRKGDAIRLSCEYYQAITSNSFQIGFSAELVIKKGGAIAYGFLGVNSLLQFEPFYFETDVRINVKIVYLGRTFMGIDLAFLLSGPQPWNAQGYAKIKLLFFSLKIKFNYSWGGTQEAVPALIASDLLLEKLKLQLLGTSNWSGKLPVHYIQSASLRSLEASEQQDQIFLHPAGYLEVRQNLIPLSRTIAKLGNSYLTSRTSYQITEYVIGNGAPVSTSSQKPLLGYFSRGQFETLTDDQKLSTADFDLMMSGIQMVPEQVYDISQELESVDNEFETFILDIEEDNLFTDSYNWQKNKLMNITAGRRPIQKSRQAELYGVLEEMPEELGKSYKIMSKATLEPIEDLAGKYFSSQSGALSYLESNLSQETKNSWQVVEALALEFEEALI